MSMKKENKLSKVKPNKLKLLFKDFRAFFKAISYKKYFYMLLAFLSMYRSKREGEHVISDSYNEDLFFQQYPSFRWLANGIQVLFFVAALFLIALLGVFYSIYLSLVGLIIWLYFLRISDLLRYYLSNNSDYKYNLSKKVIIIYWNLFFACNVLLVYSFSMWF